MVFSEFKPFSDFRTTSASVLSYLHERYGFSLWMVTRTAGENWIVLQAEDHGYNVKEGDVFRWADSFCSQMVEGRGPCVAPQSSQIPAYLAAPIGRQVDIGAYIGLPLTNIDGSLFGTLCAIDPECQPDSLVDELPQLKLVSRMLGTILASEIRADTEKRRAERAEQAAETDSLTGLFNRRGWDRLLAIEESRCRRYGNGASVLSIDLDEFKCINDLQGHCAGDAMLTKAAEALRKATRECDILARVGGDEFAIVTIDADDNAPLDLVARLKEHLSAVNIRASIGLAKRDPSKSLELAWVEADQAMYAEKRGRSRACVLI
jgi:diguanylate cyclase